MAKVYLKYNPYKMETFITVNGNEISEDSILAKLTKGKRLQEWISKFPDELVNELNTVDLDIMFYGMKLDFDDVSDVFNKAKNSGLIKKLVLDFTEGKNDDTITDDVIKIFNDLQNAPEDIDPEQDRIMDQLGIQPEDPFIIPAGDQHVSCCPYGSQCSASFLNILSVLFRKALRTSE